LTGRILSRRVLARILAGRILCLANARKYQYQKSRQNHADKLTGSIEGHCDTSLAF